MSTFQCRIFVQWSMVLVATLIFYSRSTSATRCGRILHSSSNHHAQHFQHSNQDTNRAEPLHHSHRSFVAPPLHFDRNLDHLSNRHHHSMIEHRLPTNQLHSIAPVPPTSHDAFRTSNDSNLTEQHSAFVRSASIQSSTLATLAGSPNESNAETVFGVRKRSSMSFLARSSPTNARLKPIIRLPVTPAIVRNTIEQAQPLVAYANEPVEHEIDSSSPLPHVSSSSSFIGPSASTNRRHRPTDNATSPEPGATHFPLLIHQGDAYIAYVGCALPNHLHSISMSIDRSAAGVQAAMSAVWAAHRYNQLLRAQLDAASSAFHSAIKLGVYHFELCAPTVNASALATSNQRKRFDELFRHVLHILRQSPADNRSSVFSFQPLIGLVLDVDSLSSKQLAQLAQLSLPVLTTRPTIAALVTSSGHSASRPLLLKTAASTSTLVAGLHQLISRLDWSTVHLSFCIETRSFDSNDSSNQTALFASLNNEQQAFAHEFSQFAARNSNFQLRLNQFTGQSLVSRSK